MDATVSKLQAKLIFDRERPNYRSMNYAAAARETLTEMEKTSQNNPVIRAEVRREFENFDPETVDRNLYEGELKRTVQKRGRESPKKDLNRSKIQKSGQSKIPQRSQARDNSKSRAYRGRSKERATNKQHRRSRSPSSRPSSGCRRGLKKTL